MLYEAILTAPYQPCCNLRSPASEAKVVGRLSAYSASGLRMKFQFLAGCGKKTLIYNQKRGTRIQEHVSYAIRMRASHNA